MSFFDSIMPFVEVAADIGGTILSSQANSSAADTVSSGAAQAAQIQAAANLEATRQLIESDERARAELAAGRGRGVDALDSGYGQAAGYLNAFLPSTLSAYDAGLSGYTEAVRPMLGNYNELTADQQYQLGDLQDETSARLAAGGLRGSGRAVSAVMSDVTGRYRADALDRNRARADQARTGLASVSANTAARKAGAIEGTGSRQAQLAADKGRLVAGTETGTSQQAASNIATTGSNVAGLTTDTGQSQAAATTAGSEAKAGADLANADLYGGSLGTLSSIFANENKKRSSRVA